MRASVGEGMSTTRSTIHRTATGARKASGHRFIRGMVVTVHARTGSVLAEGRITGWGTQEMQVATAEGRRSIPNVLIGEVLR